MGGNLVAERKIHLDTHRIAKVYSTYSGIYDLVFGKIFHGARETAINLLDLKPGHRVLEVGVGTGLSLQIYPRDCSIIGMDLTGPMLKKSVKRIKKFGLRNVNLQQMDASHLAFGDEHFDAVCAAYVISTVPDPAKVLAEMVRVCRPEGKIVLLNHFAHGNRFVSRFERSISPLCSRIGFRSDLSLESLLEESGLTVEQTIKVNPFHYWHIVQCVNRKSGHKSPA